MENVERGVDQYVDEDESKEICLDVDVEGGFGSCVRML
jgi:hypothetical protein